MQMRIEMRCDGAVMRKPRQSHRFFFLPCRQGRREGRVRRGLFLKAPKGFEGFAHSRWRLRRVPWPRHTFGCTVRCEVRAGRPSSLLDLMAPMG